MVKNRKKIRNNESHNPRWYFICIYLFIPIVIIISSYLILTPIIQRFMEGFYVGKLYVSNSSDVKSSIIQPFSETVAIISAFFLSHWILKIFEQKFLESETYVQPMTKLLNIIAIILGLFAIIFAIYGKVDDFNYQEYGYNVETIKHCISLNYDMQYVPLETIPNIRSIGMTGNNLIYNLLLKFAQIIEISINNLQVIAAIASVIVIRLRDYLSTKKNEHLCRT